jgi:chorismate dehydratase
MTSVMLLRIILRQKYNNSPRFDSQKIDNIYTALKAHDAVLLIGDGAILTEKSDYDHYDLASEWYSLTRLPFVFAVWAAAHPLSESEKQILNDAYAQATQNWEKIYRQAQETLPVERGFLERYYRENLRYQLSRSDYEGIARFFSYAAELGFLENVRKDVWM